MIFVSLRRIFCLFIMTIASVLYRLKSRISYAESPYNILSPKIGTQLIYVANLWDVTGWHNNGIKDCTISSNGGKSLEFYCTVVGSVAPVVCLINSLCEAVCKLLIKRSSIPLWKKYDIVVSLNSKTGTKVIKLKKISIFHVWAINLSRGPFWEDHVWWRAIPP